MIARKNKSLSFVLASIGCATLFMPVTSATYPGSDSGIVNYIQSAGNTQFAYSESADASNKMLLPVLNPNGQPNPLVSFMPEFSRNGEYMYYNSETSSGDAIFVSRIDGTGSHRISAYGISGQLKLSPDGESIAVATSSGLLLIDIETSNSEVILKGEYHHPVWSPDGRYIIVSGANGAPAKKIDLESGSALEILTNISSPYVLDWSADGTTLLIRSNSQVNSIDGSITHSWGSPQLLFSNTDGSNLRNFNRNNISEQKAYYYAVFSPDGTKILYNVTDETGSNNGTITSISKIYISDGLTLDSPKTLIEDNVTSQTDVRWRSINNTIATTLPPPIPWLKSISRFYSPVVKHHLYTADNYEASQIREKMAGVWNYEGESFRVRNVLGNCPNEENVYRFYSPQLKTHLYSMDENEKNVLVGYNRPDVWKYEGVAYCADKERISVDQVPVYRFYSPLLKTHLYTIDENEARYIDTHFPRDVWQYETIAYYVYP